jgi:prophage regulatory protein
MPDGNNGNGNDRVPPVAPPPPAPAPGAGRPRRLLGIREVMHITGLGKATIYRMLKKQAQTGEELFPRQRTSSPGRVGWLDSEIQAWIAERPAPE